LQIISGAVLTPKTPPSYGLDGISYRVHSRVKSNKAVKRINFASGLAKRNARHTVDGGYRP